MLVSYYPEMQEAKPADSQIDATMSHYGNHWYLRTLLTLKGRGITFLKTETADTLVPGSKYVGWNKYKVTERAFDAICEKHVVSTQVLL